MKTLIIQKLAALALFSISALIAQAANTYPFPSSGDVGIGTASPSYPLDVVGDIRSTGNLIEKKVVFTPTTVGWYRIISGSIQVGGTIRIDGSYDGESTNAEFVFNIRGWGQGGTITLIKNVGVNGNLIDQARISNDGGAGVYLDLHVITATTPAPITIYGYGPEISAFVANPSVGATAGSTAVRVLPIGYSVGGYDDFRTNGNVVTYNYDGSTPQGYIYHGASGQAAFGNGVVNGETWITRTGGGGTIKFGEYDFSTAFVTVDASGNVGVGTAAPAASIDIWKYYSAGTDSLRFSYNDGTSYWMGIQPYVVGAGNVGYKFRTNNGSTTVEAIAITGGGNVGIGTTNPTYKLSVNGTIRAKEVIVDTGWSDYVFDKDYRLAPLSEVEAHIKAEKHLPGIPSARDVAAHGVTVGDMQAKLLAKIEELTLHQIEQEKEITALRQQVKHLSSR